MNRILPHSFFDRPTLTVAKDLLGKFLVRKIGRRITEGMITEVEAYVGPNDRASHASRGKTARTEVMFGEPGRWYVYLVYGMHHCLNIVTERDGYPAAVLIRSVLVALQQKDTVKKRSCLNGIIGEERKVVGPGKVCQYFKIDRRLNKKPAGRASGLWIEDRGIKISPKRIRWGKRIGIEYAGEWRKRPWRFFLAEQYIRPSLRRGLL